MTQPRFIAMFQKTVMTWFWYTALSADATCCVVVVDTLILGGKTPVLSLLFYDFELDIAPVGSHTGLNQN